MIVSHHPHGVFSYRGDVSGMAVRTYWPGDEWAVAARSDLAEAFEAEQRKLPDGPRWTLVLRAQPLAIGGFECLGPREWSVWCYAADLTPRQWAFGAEIARRLSRRLKGWTPHSRLTAVASPDRPGAANLLRHIGFKPTDPPNLYELKEAA